MRENQKKRERERARWTRKRVGRERESERRSGKEEERKGERLETYSSPHNRMTLIEIKGLKLWFINGNFLCRQRDFHLSIIENISHVVIVVTIGGVNV